MRKTGVYLQSGSFAYQTGKKVSDGEIILIISSTRQLCAILFLFLAYRFVGLTLFLFFLF